MCSAMLVSKDASNVLSAPRAETRRSTTVDRESPIKESEDAVVLKLRVRFGETTCGMPTTHHSCLLSRTPPEPFKTFRAASKRPKEASSSLRMSPHILVAKSDIVFVIERSRQWGWTMSGSSHVVLSQQCSASSHSLNFKYLFSSLLHVNDHNHSPQKQR